MATTISGNQLTPIVSQGQVIQPKVQSSISLSLDFTGANADYLIDLTQQYNAGLFDCVRSLYMDNSTNPNPIIFKISGTQQTQIIAPYSTGQYNVNANAGSKFEFSSVGGATAKNNAQLQNYVSPAFVNVVNPAGSGNAVTIADGADATLGSKADAAIVNPALPGTAMAFLKGILSTLLNGVPVTPSPPTIVWTQTIVALAANVSGPIIAANANRKALRWMNVGVNPVTIVPGAVAATVNNGFNYNGNGGSGLQGASDSFSGNEINTTAYQAISLLGTTIVVWEGV